MAHKGWPYPWIFHRDIHVMPDGWAHPPTHIKMQPQLLWNRPWTTGWYNSSATYWVPSNACVEDADAGTLLWKFPAPATADPANWFEIEYALTFSNPAGKRITRFLVAGSVIAIQERLILAGGQFWNGIITGGWDSTDPAFPWPISLISNNRPMTYADIAALP